MPEQPSIAAALEAEWKAISAAPISFLAAVIVVGIVLYVVLHFTQRTRISALDERIRLRDDQLADYKNKLSGATPDEAKQRIDALEARLSALEPRRLDKQRVEVFTRTLQLHSSGIMKVTVLHDGACADCSRLGAEIAGLIGQVPGWVVNSALVIAPGFYPRPGIGVIGQKNAVAVSQLRTAFDQARIDYEFREQDSDPAILVTAPRT